jgi:two-component system response regulator PilR (NtrC family)
VLVAGESGTGKELVARALHSIGPRSSEPFVVVNCGALPEPLMESELFGHERGAFTGAIRKAEGLFRQAHGGTLFLDEIGEIPPQVQVKLLRAIQERHVRPVGSSTEVEVDVRIVAASNRDLKAEVRDGRFRSDLFYRLNVVRIEIPALRDRRDDIPALLEHFLQQYAGLLGRPVPRLAPPALERLMDYDFPGNVRELENLVERAVALTPGDEIGLEALPTELRRASVMPHGEIHLPDDGIDLQAALADYERRLIVAALERSDGVRTHAAELLGISFRSFRYRMQKLGLDGDS